MLTPSRLLTALTVTIAATAALVLVSAAGAQATPGPVTCTVSAPYPGPATFSSSTRDCDAATTCEVKGSTVAAAGRSGVAADYRRAQPVSTDSSAAGRARHALAYALPKGAETVTAVLSFRVHSASATALSTAGQSAPPRSSPHGSRPTSTTVCTRSAR